MAGSRSSRSPSVGHVARQLHCLGFQRARSLGRRGEALVQGSRLRQLGARGGQRIQPGRLIAQGADRGVGRASNRLGVGGAAQLPLQGLVLVRLHRRGRDLVDLVAQQLHPARQLVLVGEHLRGLGDGPAARRGAPLPPPRTRPSSSPKRSSRASCRSPASRRCCSCCPWISASRAPSVARPPTVTLRSLTRTTRAAVGANLAPDDGHALAGGEHVGQRVVVIGGDIGEDRFDTRRIGPGPHLVGGGASAKRQGQRVDDQRLARARSRR